MKKKSEFGKGLVLCLVYFAGHFEKLREIAQAIASYEKNKILPRDWECLLDLEKTFENLLSHKITMWANGATDHLYEIEVPKGREWSAIRKKVKTLQNIGLEMGHGFTNKIYTMDDVLELTKLTKEIAFAIDKKIGLNPIRGAWQ